MPNINLNKTPNEIVVIADIHGQLDKLEQILLQKRIIKINSNSLWEPSDDFRSGRKRVIILGDLIHGEINYINEGQQLAIIYNLMFLQKEINGTSSEGLINNDGFLIILLGNHEESELLRIAHTKTFIHKGSVHQGLAPRGVYYLANPIKQWLMNLPLSYQLYGFDFAHAGPFSGLDRQGLNKRLWDRDWYNNFEGVKTEFTKNNIKFGFYGHTAYGEEQDGGLIGAPGDVRLAADGLAAIIDVNRYTTGFIEMIRNKESWIIYKNIDSKRQIVKTI